MRIGIGIGWIFGIVGVLIIGLVESWEITLGVSFIVAGGFLALSDLGDKNE